MFTTPAAAISIENLVLVVSGCRAGGQTRGFPAQETFPAIYRAPLRWFEWNRCLAPTLRARSHCFCFGKAPSALPLRFARLAALGFILEILVVEEMLFSRREHKVSTAIYAFQYSILELRHNRCPASP
jgi:hypothetical protein